ncbi:hypothetical protein Q9L58_007682 [Maublancomyces gigas]|uniref:Increased loss of mitochondrial DNA protein 1 n=1 Tax=Discina gigas TaxID=1032678 RepID=A0ABR3GBU1_9PEZI
MALLSAYNLIRILLTAHLLFGILLIYTPKILTEQNIIFLLGEAVGLPHPKSSFHLNPLATSILGIMFIFSGISDLVVVSSYEEVSRGYWDAQAPFRMAFFFFLTAYTYVLRPGRGNTDISINPLKNSLVFTWAFVEVIMWFWIYNQLKEERRGAQHRIETRRRMQAQLNGEDVDDFGR